MQLEQQLLQSEMAPENGEMHTQLDELGEKQWRRAATVTPRSTALLGSPLAIHTLDRTDCRYCRMVRRRGAGDQATQAGGAATRLTRS
jgi:hypothetical protein